MALARHDLQAGKQELDGWWLTARQNEIASKLKGLPVREHRGIDVAWEAPEDMHQHLIAVQRRCQAACGHVLAADGAGTATFELNEPSGLVAKMVDGGMRGTCR